MRSVAFPDSKLALQGRVPVGRFPDRGTKPYHVPSDAARPRFRSRDEQRYVLTHAALVQNAFCEHEDLAVKQQSR